ncbi:MAG: hypothetical protein CUN51_03285 [Candidatus Thermofonsia Clade 1 bacterium]|uniref:WXG100 family type VII secretion target n=1 Tax=Candidatus Thermofonsia Clade 1 bacterium TaxID=2364210 RepID=A0A2M8P1E3_9CHLR|nr:MAG: hypothetical protein CUN51_03285 [Candidatus Thermofonsia Clade 1 bacterium]
MSASAYLNREVVNMGAPKIQADYDGLSEIARHFAAKAQDTNYLMQTVQRCVDELQRGAWIGRGATRFYTEMQNVVSPAMQRLRNALDEASSATTRIAQALAKHKREAGMQAERAALSAWQSAWVLAQQRAAFSAAFRTFSAN